MFKNILFATSATPACDYAARVAFELAKRFKAHVSILHVLGVPSRGYSQMVVDIRTGDHVPLDDDYKAWVNEEVKTYYEAQLKDHADCDIDIAIGYPHREILRFARKAAPDLIVMGGATDESGGAGYKKNLAGSTVQRVTKSAHCPVLIVNRPAASFWGGISNIVFGTDFSEASDVSFQYALKIATAIKNAELFIFNSVDISNFHSGMALTQDDIEDRLRAAQRTIRSKYISKLQGFKRYTVDVWEGLPYVEIVKYAREKQADLLVMCHKGQDEDPDKDRLGSNMEQVIMRANCPVMSINRHTPKLG